MANDQISEIISFEKDAAIRASAGTGKTYLLVEKYISLLCKVDEKGNFYQSDNILAITFTEKAAAEMRDRITERITKEINSLSADKGDKGKRKLSRHLLASRRRMGHAYVSTIHSFCAKVLRENPVEAGIDPQFEINDERKSSIRQKAALEQFLLQKLRKRDGDVLELAELYGFDSDFKFESSLLSAIDSLLPLMRAAGFREGDLLSVYSRLLKDGPQKLAALKSEAVSALEALKPFLKTELQIESFEEIQTSISKLAPDKSLGNRHALDMANNLFAMAKRLVFRKEEPKEASGRLKAIIEDYGKLLLSSLAEKSAKQLASLMGQFNTHMQANVKGRGTLDFADLEEKTLELFERNDSVRNRYRALFKNVLVDEFQDVNGLQKKIIDCLSSAGEGKLFIVGDLKQAIYGFRGGDFQVFEDTRKEIESSGGKTFDLQINYRSKKELVEFSNSLFSQSYREIFGEPDLCRDTRGPSFLPPVERICHIEKTEASLKNSDGNENASEAFLGVDEIRYREAVSIAQRIKELVTIEKITIDTDEGPREAGYGDIAVLFRKFSNLPLYETALRGAGVPFAVHKGSGFYQSQEVADMISLLLYIDDPGDTVSWVGALRSPYAGCSDKTILELRRKDSGELLNPIKYSLIATAPKEISEAVERDKFEEFHNWVNPLRKIKDRMKVSETIEASLEKSRMIGILGAQENGLQKVANVLKLIEIARAMELDVTLSLKNFVRRMEELFDAEEREELAAVSTADGNLVRVMTIHQSKGLEFPVVILADIDSKAQGGGSRSFIFNPRMGMAVKYVEKETLESHKGKAFDEVANANKAKEESDSARLLYVGCTRARDRLIISGGKMRKGVSSGVDETVNLVMNKRPELFYAPEKKAPLKVKNEQARSAYDILSKDPSSYASGDTATSPFDLGEFSKKTDLEKSRLFLSVTSIADFVRCPTEYYFRKLYGVLPESTGKGGLAGADSLQEIGVAVHSVLEKADFTGGKSEFGRYLKMELQKSLDFKTADIISEELKAVFDIDLFKRLREGAIKEVGREVPFVADLSGRNGNPIIVRGTIDMLMWNGKDCATALDYKYSKAKAENLSAALQLETYALACSKALKVKKINCVLAYIKGKKPFVKEWEMDNAALEKTERKLREYAMQIADIEEKARSAQSGYLREIATGLRSEAECPNRKCAYASLCFG